MWGKKKAVLNAPFCFFCTGTERAVNPDTQLARGLHYHKGCFFLGLFSELEASCTGSNASERKTMSETHLRGSGEWQVKWRVKKKKKKGGLEKLDLAHHHSAMLGIVSRTLALVHPHNAFPTHTDTGLSVSFIHSSHPESHCVFAWSVKHRKEIWVLRHFPDFTPALCFLVHPSSLTQCIPGLYRWLPLCHSCSHVMAIRAISLSSIPVYVNMAKACCKHTIQLQNNVI